MPGAWSMDFRAQVKSELEKSNKDYVTQETWCPPSEGHKGLIKSPVSLWGE